MEGTADTSCFYEQKPGTTDFVGRNRKTLRSYVIDACISRPNVVFTLIVALMFPASSTSNPYILLERLYIRSAPALLNGPTLA